MGFYALVNCNKKMAGHQFPSLVAPNLEVSVRCTLINSRQVVNCLIVLGKSSQKVKKIIIRSHFNRGTNALVTLSLYFGVNGNKIRIFSNWFTNFSPASRMGIMLAFTEFAVSGRSIEKNACLCNFGTQHVLVTR